MLAILTTHPIQYQVPLWQALAKDGRVPFEVWFLTGHGVQASHDREFGKVFAWDLNLLEGYPHRFLTTAAGATPGSFWKCRLAENFTERLQKSGVKALWVQGWQVAAYWQAIWAAKRVGAQVWLRGESNDLAQTPAWKSGIKRAILGQLFRRVDHFLYIGKANKKLYQKYGVSDNRLRPAPYAVDNERFRCQAEEVRDQRGEIRRQWGIPEEAFCVLFCGKFIQKKRPLDVLKATDLLIAQRRKMHLLYVGSGALGKLIRDSCSVIFDADADAPNQTLDKLGCSTPASFAGFLNQGEIARAYVAADCLVLPSDTGETWGLVVNEAIACGLHCIVSDQCGSAWDLVKKESRFQGGNVEDLAKKISQRINDHANGSQQSVEEFDIDATVETVCKLVTAIG